MMQSQPIVIYTCIAGLYDRELMSADADPTLKFVCFTDTPGKIRAPGWEMRKFASPPRLRDGHYINRYHKFFPHRLFPDHRWSIYIDGNLRFDGNWHDLVERVRAGRHAVGAFWHRDGHTLDREIEVCRLARFEERDFALVSRQIETYKANGMDFLQLIPTCNLLVRDHSGPGISEAMSIWWGQIFEFTKRDQISFLYALERAGIGWQPLDGAQDDPRAVDTNLVRIEWHRPPLPKRVANRLRKELGLQRR